MAAILARAGVIATAGKGFSGRRRGNGIVVAAVTKTGAAVPQEGALERPAWSGETTLSRLVGALIAFKPLYAVLKLASREVIIRTAEKSNIPWREMTKEVLESDVYEVFERIQDPNLVYPDYYLNPFHAYDEGNLSWLAAAEAEPATMSIAKRAIPEATSIEEANQIVRGNWLNVIEEHHLKYSGNCQGLDLSPYFLAVAAQKEEKLSRPKPIRWVHANGEATGLSSDSFDLVSLAYVCHECPARAITGLVKEAFRVLRPGGTIALTDNSELSPVLFTLMKSTEPFLDEYYMLDLEETMRKVGFVNVCSVLTDPRHRTVTATVPY
ncbi:CMV 1a interacting protein 1 isoform X3 [Zea mays]|uniref:CMV 1a interacting protein 1 isoform X3 n=1 Tax=Zea mays TaxID=4577 RepID=UPI0016522895|nr:CMV 1a interacting protein 1 isoform X3 [Zea mays]